MPSCLALLCAAAALHLASGDTFTGYVVDNFCWNRAGHRGIDGSQLATAPGTHILHCFWQVQVCRDGGFLMLEKLASPTAEGYTYGPGPQLDSTGNNLVYELAKQEQQRGGDRAFDEQFTLSGTMANGQLAVDQACLTPKVSNPNGQTFCLPEVVATTTGAATTTTLDPTTTVAPTEGDTTTVTMTATTTVAPTTTGDPTTTTVASGDPTTTTLAATTTMAPDTTTMAADTTTMALDTTTMAPATAGDQTTTLMAATTVVASSTTGAPTTTSIATTSVVNLDMTISGINYAALSSDSVAMASFIGAIKAGIVQEFNSRVQGQQISESNVETTVREASARRLQSLRVLQMSSGVVAESQITLPSGADASSVVSTLQTASSTLEGAVATKIQAVANIQSVTSTGATIGVSGATVARVMETTTTPMTPMQDTPSLTGAAALRAQTPAGLALLLAVAALKAHA